MTFSLSRKLDTPSHRRFKRTPGLRFVCVIGLILTAAWWAANQHYAHFVVAVVAVFLSLIGVWLASRALSLWLICTLTIHVGGGMALDGYARPYFDIGLHFGFIGWLTFLTITALNRREQWQALVSSRSQLLAVGLLFGLGVGAAWEIFEYLIDLTGVYQAQQGLSDTMTDLLADGAGSAAAVISTFVWQSSARSDTQPKLRLRSLPNSKLE